MKQCRSMPRSTTRTCIFCGSDILVATSLHQRYNRGQETTSTIKFVHAMWALSSIETTQINDR